MSDGDLYNWRHAGLVFAANATGAHCLERPKVIKCPGTGKYVLWAKGFTPMPANAKLAVVALADTPLGPFKLLNEQEPFYAPANTSMADATLFVDNESKPKSVWLYWRTPSMIGKVKGGFMAAKLNKQCTALESETGAVRIADVKHEAPAVFKVRFGIW